MASVQKETPLFPTSQVSGLWRFSGLLIVSYLGALTKTLHRTSGAVLICLIFTSASALSAGCLSGCHCSTSFR